MDNDFKQLLEKAKNRIENKFVYFEESGQFSWLYPFTTENIKGYINLFDLRNKSLLTVGSSGDQVINAALKGCKDQTILDICPYAKYYFYLKKAALLTLSYEEFINFFCFIGYPETFEDNYQVFNMNAYKKVRLNLKELNEEAFMFWDELFNTYYGPDIRVSLFNRDETSFKCLKRMNLYLSSEALFNKTKINIKEVNPKFLTGDIFKLKLNRIYNNIFLSNLCTYYCVSDLKKLVESLNKNLNSKGNMLIAYLYDTTKDTKYKNNWIEIYNIEKTLKLFSNYKIDFESFIGTKGLDFENENIKDSIMIYRKKR